jgi:hypothetical protein
MPGGVQVPHLFSIENYPTVLQMTSTITARTRPEVTLDDVFAALFPCGSITGAPKLKSMDIIAELEKSPRAVYCGAIGHVAPGQPVQEIRRFWARIQKDIGIEDVRIHDLRHTFASLLVSGGASLEMIGKLLGHSQMQTTQRYAHLMDSPLRAGVGAVASAFKPKPRLVHDAQLQSADVSRAETSPLIASGA